jgi:vitamin B12 transporter
LEQQLLGGKLLVEAVYFMNSYQNLITFDMLDGYINIGRARSRGVEISAEARPEENLLLKTSYIRMEAKDVDKNVALLRRPRDKFTASLDYLFHQKWSFSLQALYTGERDDVDYSQWPYPQLTLPAYFICHASVGFDFSRAVQLFARFDNIFNKKYEMVFGYGTYGFSSCAGAKVLF